MRDLEREEIKKRGCKYCADMREGWKPKKYKNSYTKYDVKCYVCPYDKCPYKELDKFDTYTDYLRGTEPFQFNMPRES